MNDKSIQSRRNVLRLGGMALAMIPVIAFAAKNEGIRKSMQYQDTPKGDQRCGTCAQFVPGKSPTDAGGCKVYPGDTEISPNGWCIAYAKKP